eukprot:CAMPEP_0202912416 /NCGR_PEP_ID=MMETSP1392-20130828/57693_1 /ASSEMBLY_ACC=CAM_ASM_000868 /TAXON_ID=225041 /ORGANISM="Chlamydomonas chlamydogama, Strain SAG 11-48b" /LENGTH=142 /DNA_ID=CAMNT_0049603307 /DNA_START=112 /DNA_END=537 /DNA_ORIENTATION=+
MGNAQSAHHSGSGAFHHQHHQPQQQHQVQGDHYVHQHPHQTQRYMTGDAASRITVDIRGNNLDSNWNVYVKRQEAEYNQVENNIRSVSNTLNAVGGVVISVLTIVKLVEEIRFMRSLRGELSSIASTFADGETQLGARQEPR